MSTVCGVHVEGWAGVGACSAEVGGPAGSAGGRLGVDYRSFDSVSKKNTRNITF